MSKPPFVPPPPFDGEIMDSMIETIADMSEEERLQLLRGDHLTPYARDKYLRRLEERKKEAQRKKFQLWWWGKGIQLVNLLLALVAAITGIIALLR